MTFHIERQNFVVRIVRHRHEPAQRNRVLGRLQNRRRQLVVPLLLLFVFAEHGPALVGPANYRLTNIIGEDRMSDFVREDRDQKRIQRSLQIHRAA